MKRVKINMRYGSHLPILMKIAQITSGPILELGGGLWSTPFLHWECFRTERKLVTYEHHPVYYRSLEQYRRPWHEVFLAEDWDAIDISGPWSLALVDHDPLDRRPIEAGRLLHADYVVFHDATDPARDRHDYPSVWRKFKYQHLFNKVGSPSMILSNKHDLSNFTVKP